MMYITAAFLAFLAGFAAHVQAVEYTTAHPLSSVVNTPIKDCGKFTELPVPMLAWLGDMPTIAANGYTETTSFYLYADDGNNNYKRKT